VHQEI
jgi:hypothetical protein